MILLLEILPYPKVTKITILLKIKLKILPFTF